MAIPRRWWLLATVAVVTFVLWRQWSYSSAPLEFEQGIRPPDYESNPVPEPDATYFWRKLKIDHPVDGFRSLPREPQSPPLPPVQAARFHRESSSQRSTRLARRKVVEDTFGRAWDAYKLFAWLRDEVTPISGQKRDPFGGWGATLVDSLDTLWIMGMHHEFDLAVTAVDRDISFETTAAGEVNVFETTIRFLGGLLSAYQLSGDGRLLAKARDVGDMLYKAFDTPNHLPISRWDIRVAREGAQEQKASGDVLLAELGSLSMEFTHLSILTGDPKFHDAVQRISEFLAAAQDSTKIPGLWPIAVDAAAENFDVGTEYTWGGMADSVYEYMPKMVAMLDDGNSSHSIMYAGMYEKSVRAAREHLLFRPMTPGGEDDDILFLGSAHTTERSDGGFDVRLDTQTGHLTCFAGGMLALGGRLISDESHVELGAKITKGCIWAYTSTPTGVMPELFHLQSCPRPTTTTTTTTTTTKQDPIEDPPRCAWSDARWHEGIVAATSNQDVLKTIDEHRLPRGYTSITDRRYILRPEAIESVFVLYRVTGDAYWQERAWEMWTAIEALTTSVLANSAVADVAPPEGQKSELMDSMESFWMGETLKYFYLIFSDPGLISLDDWVFNTEAHPFRRRTGAM